MIAIIDYGVGNLSSVKKALDYIGVKSVVTSDRETILNADSIVLSGVGAFADAMNNLKRNNMVELIRGIVNDKKPLLGICLGMQLLFEYSEEGNGTVEGLGIFKGNVKKFPENLKLKIPHVGWNRLDIKNNNNLFYSLDNSPYVYFVHSYYVDATDKDIVVATTNYGIDFETVIVKDNITATQFHPEKSGEIGLTILKNWVENI